MPNISVAAIPLEDYHHRGWRTWPDATVGLSMLDGVVVGAESVRSVVITIKSLYDRQEFKFVGPYGDNGWIEDYIAEVHGKPLGCVVLIKRNDAGQTQHVVASYRPRTRSCTSPACWRRSSRAPPLPNTSPLGVLKLLDWSTFDRVLKMLTRRQLNGESMLVE